MLGTGFLKAPVVSRNLILGCSDKQSDGEGKGKKRFETLMVVIIGRSGARKKKSYRIPKKEGKERTDAEEGTRECKG